MKQVGRTSWVVAGLVAAALTLAVISVLMRGMPESYPVGDGAILEIYTLHASKGQLTVGPYSRFGWNHPGPMYFYGLAPAYLLSGHREESLLVTVLIGNLVVMGFALAVAWRYGGWSLMIALAIWLSAYYLRPSSQYLWDPGDLLSSSWNPHAPLLPFLLLLILAAALSAGHLVVLPAIVAVASFISQTHAAFLPLSLLIVGTAGLIWLMGHRPFRLTAIPTGPVTNWVRLLDALGLFYAFLLVGVVLIGGFDLSLGGFRLTARSADKLLLYLLVIVGLRHVISRRHPLIHRVVMRVRSAPIFLPLRVWFGTPRMWPGNYRAVVVTSVVVLAVAWCLPLVGEFTGYRPGNLRTMIRSVGSERSVDPGAGLAGMALELTAVLRPKFEVAYGGRILTVADLSWPATLMALAQVVGLLLVLRAGVNRGRAFQAGLAAMALIASAGAVWASVRVGDLLYDHLIFWISMLGVFNLTVLTAAAFRRWMPEQSPQGGAGHVVVIGVVLASMAVHGGSHILEGHHRARFEAERQAVHLLSDGMATALKGVDGTVRVEVDQDTWAIASGLILWLYQRDVPLTVSEDWVSLYGSALAPTGRETSELVIAGIEMHEHLRDDPRYALIAHDGDVWVYHRPLVPTS